MSERNPYEIRTRMLEIAADYMQTQYRAAEDLAKATFQEMVKTGFAMQTDWSKYAPKMYDPKDILEMAQQLYGFVNTKSKS